MTLLEAFFTSRLGSIIIMICIVILFMCFLRFLYGPKGILRKSLWDGIDDSDDSDDIDSDKNNKTPNATHNKKDDSQI